MMFSSIRKRFTYVGVGMIFALVFAMSGGAYATNRYLLTSTKQISPKVLSTLKGKQGPKGAAGPGGTIGQAGPQGPQGPKGETGLPGLEGKAGTNGIDGTDGVKGEKGEVGAAGSPWTAGGTLPTGKTETGAWSYSTPAAGAVLGSAISFPIRLVKALDKGHVHYIGGSGTANAECPGTAEEPTAKPGNLCVYQGFANGVEEVTLSSGEAKAVIFPPGGSPFEGEGAGPSGAGLLFVATEKAFGTGSWAVTEK